MWEENLKKIIDEKKMYDEEVNLGAFKEEIDKLRRHWLFYVISNQRRCIIELANGRIN